MKVTLIEPNLNCGNVKPPLGIGHIAASLKNRGIPYEFMDLSFDNPSIPFIQHLFRSKKLEIAAISCYSWDYIYAVTIANIIKEQHPDSIIVMGGETPSGDPELVFNDCKGVDIIVRGEGEHTMIELMEALETKKDLHVVEGISFRNEHKIHHTKPRVPVKDVDSLPSPFLTEVFDIKKYKSAYIMTVRGCPYHCIYCSWGGRRLEGIYRPYSIQRIIDELRYLHENGIQTINPGDGTFNSNPKRMLELCAAVKKENFSFKWYDVDMRADLVTREQLQALKAINTTEVGFGMETINPKTQKIIGKNLDTSCLPDAVRMAKEEGLEVHVSMMIGLPGETREDVLKTIAFAKALKATRYGIFPLRIQPGTPLYEDPGKYNIRILKKGCSPSLFGENEHLSYKEIRELEALASSQMINLNTTPPRVREIQFFNDFLS